VDSIGDERVTVEWAESDGKDQVLLHPSERDSRDASTLAHGNSPDR